MTDHLPECLRIEYMVSRHGYTLTASSDRCICAPLRACERRVLNAAREAVESVWTLDPSWDGTNWNNALYEAVAAINALREEGSGNPDNPTSAGKPDKPGERRQFTLDEYEDVKRRAYFAGLDAAREAINKIPREDGGYSHVLHACDVEAVIDDLREGK